MAMRIVAAVAAAVLLAGTARAVEAPPVQAAGAVLGSLASGPNYRVESEVHSDGLLNLYVLRTKSGNYEIAGTDFLRLRIRELAALRKLQAMSESDVFVKSLGESAAAPLRFGADLITDPGQTLRKSVSGVANMFDRVGAGLSNMKSNRDNVVTSVLGVDSARRTLAVQLGVDPYTDFPPLAAKLNDVATASAMGGLSVKGLMMAIPGGAGVAISSVSTADTVKSLLAEKTSAQVIEIVLSGLARMRVPPALAQRLVQNRNFTPADLLIIVAALRDLKGQGAMLFIAKAADAQSREEAFFQRRRVELIATNAKGLGIGGFVDVAGFPMNRLADGRLIALFPFDDVAWTQRVAGLVSRVQAATAGEAQRPVLAISGTVTPMARAELTKLGWGIERVR